MVGSDTSFQELRAHVSLKVNSKDYFRDKGTMKILIFRLLF